MSAFLLCLVAISVPFSEGKKRFSYKVLSARNMYLQKDGQKVKDEFPRMSKNFDIPAYIEGFSDLPSFGPIERENGSFLYLTPLPPAASSPSGGPLQQIRNPQARLP